MLQSTNYPNQQKLLQLFNYDPLTGNLTWRVRKGAARVGMLAGHIVLTGHRQVQIDKRLYYAHVLIWIMQTGFPPKISIDHENRNPDDNRWENLREATFSQQVQNQNIRSDNTSGVTGVSWNKLTSKWQAYIKPSKDSNLKSLGFFKNFDDAVAARKAAELKYFGEFAP